MLKIQSFAVTVSIKFYQKTNVSDLQDFQKLYFWVVKINKKGIIRLKFESVSFMGC